jgi:hypothetical protein
VSPVTYIMAGAAALIGWVAYEAGNGAGYRAGFIAGERQGKESATAACSIATTQASREAVEQLLRLQAEQAEQERKANEAVRKIEREAQLEREDVDRRLAALREQLRLAQARAAGRVRDSAGRAGMPEAASAAGGRIESAAAGTGLVPGFADPTERELVMAERGEKVLGQFRSWSHRCG